MYHGSVFMELRSTCIIVIKILFYCSLTRLWAVERPIILLATMNATHKYPPNRFLSMDNANIELVKMSARKVVQIWMVADLITAGPTARLRHIVPCTRPLVEPSDA